MDEVPIKIGKTKEHLDILQTLGHGLFLDD